MSRRGAWKTREAARAEADPELVERLQVACLEARKIDDLADQAEREATAGVLGRKLNTAKRNAESLGPGVLGLVAVAAEEVERQAAHALRTRTRIVDVRGESLARLEARGLGGGASGRLGEDEPGRAALVRSLLSFTTPAPGAAELALAAIGIGFEVPPRADPEIDGDDDVSAWKRLRDAYGVELKRHSK